MNKDKLISKMADVLFRTQSEMEYMHPDQGVLRDRGRRDLGKEIKDVLQKAEQNFVESTEESANEP